MNKLQELPKKIPVFPLSNFIIFPKSIVPLNIFEPRNIEMINYCMKKDRIIGMIQPLESTKDSPELHKIGCAGKITSFNETEDGRYLIVLNGISRFRILNENQSGKLYRECTVDFREFLEDVNENKLKKDLNLDELFKKFKTLFSKEGYAINWRDLEKQNKDQTVNTLSMASPFALEEKQVLLEAKTVEVRKEKLEKILDIYLKDNFQIKTIQ